MGGRGISRCGIDRAGGLLIRRGGWRALIEGAPIACQWDIVTGHGKHKLNVMIEGVGWFRIGGIPACRAQHRASCGHSASGASWIRILE